MDNKDLYEELRGLRKDIQELQKEFYIFKGKSFGVIGILTMAFHFVGDYLKQKLFH